MIYLDNAATSMRKPDSVIQAVSEAMQSMGNAGRGTHSASLGTSRTVFGTRQMLARFFHANDPRQVVFTANSTESLNIAIKGLFGSGDHVISTVMEHNSVLRPLYELRDQGMELSFVQTDEKGRPLYEQFESLIQENTRGIVCTHASNLTGNMVDLKKVGDIAKAHHLLLIVDASQTAGVYDIDVNELGIDVLCFTGHKSLLGPQGTGGMIVKEGVRIRPLLSGGTGIQTYNHYQPEEMPTLLEAGTLNGHGIAGLHAAIEYLNEEGLDTIRNAELSLMRRFYEGVLEIPGIVVYGDFETQERCPVVSLNLGDYDSGEVSDELAERFAIATRPGGHCAPLMHEALQNVEQGCVRFSFSHYNTEEEIDTAVEAVRILATE